MAETEKAPEPVKEEERDDRVLQTILAYKKESESARVTRKARNAENFDAYHGRQDWSYKQEGQSTEFLPKVSGAVEQFCAFAKRGMVQFGDWFSVEVPDNYPLSAASVQRLMKHFLTHLYDGPTKTTDIALRVSDGLKCACLESLFAVKINGRLKEEDGKEPSLQLQVDLVRNEDYNVDPTGRGLYEVHTVERDLHEIQDMAAKGAYDDTEVLKIQTDFAKNDAQDQNDQRTGQDTMTKSSVRKRIQIDELWGTALHDGKVIGKNIVATAANERYMIRKITPNPFWHGESPFVVSPLIRVPHSVWHKALMDDAVSLNFAQNELFNLILDGGMSSVWGTRQVRSNYLKNPGDISDGIPPAATLEVTDDLPPGQKVVETVSTGNLPPESMAIYNLLGSEFVGAAMTNELRMGTFPSKQVKATEAVEAQQANAVLVDSVISDFERECLVRILWKSWAVIVQFMDHVSLEVLANCCTKQEVIMLARMPEDERRRMVTATFKVHGLSSTLNRIRDFQKFMALIETVGKNPMMLKAFVERFSGTRMLDKALRLLNIDPREMELTQEERMAAQAQPGPPQGPGTPGVTADLPGSPAATAMQEEPMFHGGEQPGTLQ